MVGGITIELPGGDIGSSFRLAHCITVPVRGFWGGVAFFHYDKARHVFEVIAVVKS